jgi:signal transduction histidine kinase
MTDRIKRVFANRRAGSLILLAVTAVLAAKAMRDADRCLRATIGRDVRLLGQTLDAGQLATLAGSPSDLGSPVYRRLREQFQAVCRARPDYRCVYLITKRRVQPGESAPADLAEYPLMYLVDSEPEDSENYGAPGTRLAPIHADDMRLYDAAEPLVKGPMSDAQGTWVIAGAPLSGPQRGGVLAWLCIDVDARVWRPQVARAALPTALAAVGLLCLLWVPALRTAHPRTSIRRQVLRTLLAGLVLTAYAANWAHGVVMRNRSTAFAGLAEIQTHRVLERLQNLDRVTLAGFDAHLRTEAASGTDRFRTFAEALSAVRGVLSWECLSEGAREADSWPTRSSPAADCDALRHREAVACRASAASVAQNSGLSSASALFTCRMSDGSTNSLFYVFRPAGHPQQARAAVGALLVPERFEAEDLHDLSCSLRWCNAEASDGKEERSLVDVRGLRRTGAALSRPLLLYGAAFFLEAEPTALFFRAYPDQTTPLVALIGLLITLVGTAALWQSLMRREALERLVGQRTRDLQDSEAEVKRLLARRTEEWREATAAALAAGEEAAGRIGRELHDTLCQELIGMARQAGAFQYIDCTTPAACTLLQERIAWIAAQSTASARRARELSHQLALGDPADKTLSEALADNLAQLASLYSLRYELDIDAHLPAFAPEAVNHLVRIVREAVVNAARHSRAEKVWLAILGVDSGVSVSLASDGVTPDAPSVWREGLGLRQMRMRAVLLGATLNFQNEAGRVTAELFIPGTETR